MAAKGLGSLHEAMSSLRVSKPSLMKTFRRSLATEAPAQNITRSATAQQILDSWNPTTTVPVTIHSFPSLEPASLEHWSIHHLHLPLRRDILHLAVVHEGTHHRQGTASTKTRWEVHGSHRKIRPQKGSGMARLGTKQSPMLRGGGVSHGPKPRDWGNKMNRKMYDKAWRVALSYRYRKGELIVCEDGMELPLPRDFELLESKYLKNGLRESYMKKYAKGVMKNLGLGKEAGRTLFVTGDRRERLWSSLELIPREGRALEVDEVDVKDLLEQGKIVMERAVLQELVQRHQSDLVSRIQVNGTRDAGPSYGVKVLAL